MVWHTHNMDIQAARVYAVHVHPGARRIARSVGTRSSDRLKPMRPLQHVYQDLLIML